VQFPHPLRPRTLCRASRNSGANSAKLAHSHRRIAQYRGKEGQSREGYIGFSQPNLAGWAETMHRRRRLLSAFTLREPVSSASSCFRRAVLYALPWGQPLAAVRFTFLRSAFSILVVSATCTSFAAISSGSRKTGKCNLYVNRDFCWGKDLQRSHLAEAVLDIFKTRAENPLKTLRRRNSEKLESSFLVSAANLNPTPGSV